MSAPQCPTWCTTTGEHQHAHEGLLFESPGSAAVTVNGDPIQPIEMSVWDQTGTAGDDTRRVLLCAGQARALARIVVALDPSEVVRFAKALADGAALLDDEGEVAL